jgi:hypothetical protein
MKSKILLPVLVLVFFTTFSTSYAAKKNNPAGKWNFEIQNAPQAYSTGTIEITRVKRKYHATIMFAGSENKFEGTKVSFEKNNLLINFNIRENDVAINLMFVNEKMMTGKASTPQDEATLTLTRDIKKK